VNDQSGGRPASKRGRDYFRCLVAAAGTRRAGRCARRVRGAGSRRTDRGHGPAGSGPDRGLFGADPVHRTTVGHRHHPRHHASLLGTETGRRAPHLDHDLLRDLLGLRGIAQYLQHQPENRTGDGVVQGGESFLVATGNACDDFGKVRAVAVRPAAGACEFLHRAPPQRRPGPAWWGNEPWLPIRNSPALQVATRHPWIASATGS